MVGRSVRPTRKRKRGKKGVCGFKGSVRVTINGVCCNRGVVARKKTSSTVQLGKSDFLYCLFHGCGQVGNSKVQSRKIMTNRKLVENFFSLTSEAVLSFSLSPRFFPSRPQERGKESLRQILLYISSAVAEKASKSLFFLRPFPCLLQRKRGMDGEKRSGI